MTFSFSRFSQWPPRLPGRARGLAAACALIAGFSLLTVWFTFPQIIALDHVVPHQDPMFSTWRLAWVAHQLPRAPLHLLDTNLLYPARATAVFSDAALLLGVLAAPLIWMGVPAVVAYNVMLLASFVCAALGAFLLVRELTGSVAGGVFAGIAFAFCPFRFEHYMHLEIVWSCWIPLTLWALHRTIATGRLAYGILTGLCIAAQFYSCVYLAIFLVTWLIFIGILLVAFRLLDLRGRAVRALFVGAILGAAIVAPYGRAYMASSRVVGTRSVEETRMYSAGPSAYLSSPASNWLYGWTIERVGFNEKQLFPGVTVVVLALVGLWPPFSRLRLIYALAVLFAIDLAAGLRGFTYGPLREAIPFFQGLRVPARAVTLMQLGLAVLGGYGIARLLQPRGGGVGDRAGDASGLAVPGRRARAGTAIALAAGVLLMMEFTNRRLVLTPLPTRPTVLQEWLARERDLVLLEMPVPRTDRLPGEDPRYQFLSTFHWQRMVNGYTAFVPPQYLRLLDLMVTFPDQRSIGAIRARGVTHLVIHPELYQAPPPAIRGRTLVEQLAVSPDFAFMGWFPDGIGTAAVFRVVRNPR